MKLHRFLIVNLLAVLVSSWTYGQYSYVPACSRYPADENISQEIIQQFNSKGKMYTSRGNIEGLNMSLKIMSDLNSFSLPLIKADIKTQKGIINYYNNNNVEALKDYFEAFNLYNRLGNESSINVLLNNIAIIFTRVDDYESTLKYLKKGLDYTEKSDKTTRSGLMLNIAETEAALGNYDTSLKIGLDLFNDYNPSGANYDLISVIGEIINSFNLMGRYDDALNWINKTNDSLITKAGYLDKISFFPYAMDTYFELGDYKKVIEAGKLIYPPDNIEFLPEIYDALDLMSRSYAMTGQYSHAKAMEDILKEIEFSRTSYSREELITLLMTEYSFNLDNISRKNLENELIINREKAKALRNLLFWIILGTSLVLLVSIVLFRTRRTMKHYKKLLAVENSNLGKLSRELAINNSVLENENSFLDTLISVFAHDLINPFQAILGFSRLMISDYDTIEEENIIEYTSLLSETSLQLNQLLINLKNMAVLQNEIKAIESAVFKIDPVIKEIVSLYTPIAKRKNIILEYNGDKKANACLSKEVYQSVVRNILSNAIKFSLHDSKIEINTSTEENYSVTTVKDYGIGMSDDTRERLINHQYLNSSPGTMKEKGSGIGLSISIELLELSKGKINIESQKDKGTVIKIYTPT